MPRPERIKSGSKDRIKSNKINVPGIESYTGGVVQRDEALGESRYGVELPPPLLHRLHHGAPNAPPRRHCPWKENENERMGRSGAHICAHEREKGQR
jgi:hypothetical protein